MLSLWFPLHCIYKSLPLNWSFWIYLKWLCLFEITKTKCEHPFIFCIKVMHFGWIEATIIFMYWPCSIVGMSGNKKKMVNFLSSCWKNKFSHNKAIFFINCINVVVSSQSKGAEGLHGTIEEVVIFYGTQTGTAKVCLDLLNFLSISS